MTERKGFASWVIGLFQAQDMTVGSPISCLLKFSLPMLVGNIVQMLYNTVDSIVVGKYVGDSALAAIGVSAPLQNIFLVFFMAIGAGVSVMVAQYFGARETQNLGNTIGNSISLIFIVSVAIMAIATPLTPYMLRWINTPPEMFDMAKTYLIILFLGAAGNGFYNILTGVLRGLGQAIFPFVVLLCASALNVVLDIWFVAGLQMGIGGAALATIICQILSAIVCLIKVLSIKKIVTVTRVMLRLKKSIVWQIFRLGIPSGISMGVMFASTLFIQSLVNSMGYLVTAAITVTVRIDGFAILPSQTFGMAASTFTGQNVGAGKLDRVKKGAITVFVMCSIFTVLMVACMLLFGYSMTGLFTETKEVMDMSMNFIRIMVPGYLIMVISNTLMGVMRGAGDTIGPMWLSLLNNVAIRVPASYIIAWLTKSETYPHGNPNSTFYGLLIALVLGSITSAIYYRTGRWKNKSIIGIIKSSEDTAVAG